MNIKETIWNKASGFYVGVVGAAFALVTLFVYIAMDSMYFTWLVALGLMLGIVVFGVSALLKFRIGIVISYLCYMFALYHFLVLEVDYRMDVLVDPAQGFMALDAIFLVACAFFLAAIIVTIVSSCMKQDKNQ